MYVGKEKIEVIAFFIAFFFTWLFVKSITEDKRVNKGDIVGNYSPVKNKKSEIEKIVKENEKFDEINFLNYVKNTFIIYYKNNKENEKDIIEGRKSIKINNSRIISYNKENEKEIIKVILDYTETVNEYNEITGEQIRGLTRNYDKTVSLTFEKNNLNLKDKSIKTVKCLSCGAPTEIITSGKCQYCGAKVNADDMEWVMKEIKKVI